jgi:hypothetical protein
MWFVYLVHAKLQLVTYVYQLRVIKVYSVGPSVDYATNTRHLDYAT